jgi:hypothetical protein
LEAAPALLAVRVTGPLHKVPSKLTALYTAEATPLPLVVVLKLAPPPLMRPHEAVKLTFTGVPLAGAPPIEAVTDKEVFPPEATFALPSPIAERLKLLEETAKSVCPVTVAPLTSALADKVAAPSAVTEDTWMLTCATPDESVSAVAGETFAIVGLLTVKVTSRFATGAPA